MSAFVSEQTVIGITLLTGEMLLSRLFLGDRGDLISQDGTYGILLKNLKNEPSVMLKDPLILSMQPQGKQDESGRTHMAVGFAPFQPSAPNTPQGIASDKILAWFLPAAQLESAYVQTTSGIVIPRPKISGNQNGQIIL